MLKIVIKKLYLFSKQFTTCKEKANITTIITIYLSPSHCAPYHLPSEMEPEVPWWEWERWTAQELQQPAHCMCSSNTAYVDLIETCWYKKNNSRNVLNVGVLWWLLILEMHVYKYDLLSCSSFRTSKRVSLFQNREKTEYVKKGIDCNYG